MWSQIACWTNLVEAARKARRGKADREVVRRFEFRREHELSRLLRELEGGEYRPGPYTTHWIHIPKPRLISAAPYRDRVVHHAILNVLEPILDRHFHPDSFACRKGKGTHAAARRLQALMRRNAWTLQGDVRKFFPSINHAILKQKFSRLLKDTRLLLLLDAIVDNSNEQEPILDWFPGDGLFAPQEHRRGMPIGNLTSQWFANWYLTGFDHEATSGWGVGGYVRYCDDFVLLDDNRSRLADLARWAQQAMAGLRLRLHGPRLHLSPSSAGRMFVGFGVTPLARRLRNACRRAFLRRLDGMRRALRKGRLTREAFRCRVMAWLGHATQAGNAQPSPCPGTIAPGCDRRRSGSHR